MKKEKKTELTRERIISAAMQEFGKNGYAASTLNAICSSDKISKGLLYHNFRGKDELYLICAKRCFQEVADYLQSLEKPVGLHQYLEKRYQYFSEHPLCAHIFFEAVLQPPEGLADAIRELKSPFDAFNRRIYRDALSGIKLRSGVTTESALAYFEVMQEMFNGYFNSPAYAGKDLDIVMATHEDELMKMLDFMLYGIAEGGEQK